MRISLFQFRLNLLIMKLTCNLLASMPKKKKKKKTRQDLQQKRREKYSDFTFIECSCKCKHSIISGRLGDTQINIEIKAVLIVSNTTNLIKSCTFDT